MQEGETWQFQFHWQQNERRPPDLLVETHATIPFPTETNLIKMVSHDTNLT